MAVNRTKTMLQACRPVWARRRRGFLSGFDSLVSMGRSPKSAVLLFTASEVETRWRWCAAGLLGGMGRGIAQAYTTMGAYTLFVCYLILTLNMRLDYWLLHGRKYLSFPADLCTCMTTVEITHHKQAASGVKLFKPPPHR
jgi:hypothetical protein